MYTFHLEAVADPATLSSQSAHEGVVAVAQDIRNAGMKVGVALKPATPVELLFPYLDQSLLDMVSSGRGMGDNCGGNTGADVSTGSGRGGGNGRGKDLTWTLQDAIAGDANHLI
jgi:hypothetical protein